MASKWSVVASLTNSKAWGVGAPSFQRSGLTCGLPECRASGDKKLCFWSWHWPHCNTGKIEILYLQMLVSMLSHYYPHTGFWYWEHLNDKVHVQIIKAPYPSCRWSLRATWHRSHWQEVVIGPCWGFRPCPAAGKFLYNNCNIMVEMQNWSVHKGPIHATMLHLRLSCCTSACVALK